MVVINPTEAVEERESLDCLAAGYQQRAKHAAPKLGGAWSCSHPGSDLPAEGQEVSFVKVSGNNTLHLLAVSCSSRSVLVVTLELSSNINSQIKGWWLYSNKLHCEPSNKYEEEL